MENISVMILKQGWRDGSVGKKSVVQAQGPEFGSPSPTWKLGTIALSPQCYRAEMGRSQGLIDQNDEHLAKMVGVWFILIPAHRSIYMHTLYTHAHTHTRAHAYTHLYV